MSRSSLIPGHHIWELQEPTVAWEHHITHLKLALLILQESIKHPFTHIPTSDLTYHAKAKLILLPMDQIQPLACFCKYSFIGTQSRPFLYILSMAAFALNRQSSVVVTKAIWPAKCDIFTEWHFLEEVC